MKFSTKRGIVVGIIFFSVIVGLVVHTGTGTESALGWRDIALICPVGALEALAGSRGLALHVVALLAVSLVIGVVFGKAFCSWACPTRYFRGIFAANGRRKPRLDDGQADGAGDGDSPVDSDEAEGDGADGEAITLADGEALAQADGTALAHADGEAIAPANGEALAPVGGERDGFRLDSRHVVLGGAVLSSFVFGFPVFCLICPVGLTFGLVIGLFNLVVHAEASWGILIALVVLVLELVVFRKWCTHLCPISALLSLLSAKNTKLNPKVDRTKCLREKGRDCRTCVDECPERVDPHTESIPECSKCGICADKCPAQAIAFKMSRKV